MLHASNVTTLEEIEEEENEEATVVVSKDVENGRRQVTVAFRGAGHNFSSAVARPLGFTRAARTVAAGSRNYIN